VSVVQLFWIVTPHWAPTYACPDTFANVW
jgi:hypothetical protein